MNERAVLVLFGLGFLLVAERSWHYPPNYLVYSPAWAAGALLTSFACLAAAGGARWAVALSGGMVIASSVARASIVVAQLIAGTGVAAQQASFAVGATVWVMLAILAWRVWAHELVPWSAVHERRTHGG